jgi:hypothetical protein
MLSHGGSVADARLDKLVAPRPKKKNSVPQACLPVCSAAPEPSRVRSWKDEGIHVTCKTCKVPMKELKGHIYHKKRKWKCPKCARVKMQKQE